MALTKADREFIQATQTNAISEALKPVADLVNRHDQTLYGPKGENGMRKDVDELKCWKQTLTVQIAKIGGIIMGGSAVISAIISWFLK